jgi:hypothetical protein
VRLFSECRSVFQVFEDGIVTVMPCYHQNITNWCHFLYFFRLSPLGSKALTCLAIQSMVHSHDGFHIRGKRGSKVVPKPFFAPRHEEC